MAKLKNVIIEFKCKHCDTMDANGNARVITFRLMSVDLETEELSNQAYAECFHCGEAVAKEDFVRAP